MKYLKTYEENNTYNKYPISWYEGKWYIHYSITYKFKAEKNIGYLVLVKEIVDTDKEIINSVYKIRGESIKLEKNGDVYPGSSISYNYSKKEFDELDFITTEDFFIKHKDIFISLFNKCAEDIESGNFVEYYKKQVKTIFNLLLPVLRSHTEEYNEYLTKIDAKKYNL
jgi:hypothetical protein